MIGRVTVITGPMYSSKTYELIKRVRRREVQGIRVKVFHPNLDGVKIESRDGSKLASTPLSTLLTKYELICEWIDFEDDDGPLLIVIEEAQFFTEELTKAIDFCRRSYGIDFIVSGLTRSYTGEGFGCFPTLLVLADDIICLKAICSHCKREDATWTVRTDDSNELVKIGSKGYEARCVRCA